jgi:transcriptional regulator with XRE-family HTH domain
MSFGERLRKVRTEQGMTAKDLSEASGVPEKNIYRIETGEVADPHMSTVVPLIKALNCSADEIIFNAEDFTKLAHLRQLFVQFSEFREDQQELLLNVIQKINLAYAVERQISETGLVPIDKAKKD